MTDNLLKSQAFKLKGRLYTFTVMHLLSVDIKLFELQLAEVVDKAPRMFDKTPIILDCSAIDGSQLDLRNFCEHMRETGLIPIAIQGGDPFLETIAQCQGIAIVSASSSHSQPSPRKKQTQEKIPTKLLTTPVRSGQQVVSQGGDLIITAPVSHGAEVLADGNIHIYGALRGRALAGIAGNKNARIFCQSLEAELVSIAGFYRLSDTIEPVLQPCQIFLLDDHIQIETL